MNEQNQIGWMNTKLTKHMTTNDNDQVHNICGMPPVESTYINIKNNTSHNYYIMTIFPL